MNNAKSNTINIINKYNYLFTDSNKIFELMNGPKYSTLGKYIGQPKVHEKESNGNPEKAIRGLIYSNVVYQLQVE